MFNKLKQIRDLRSQAKKIQNVLADESTTSERSGVKVVMNGNLEITELTIPIEMHGSEAAAAVKTAVNDAIKNVQKIMARKMQEMGGLPKFN